MAIDDNTSYELTGAQVKDLANRINNAGGSVDGNKVWYATSSSVGYTSNKIATISGGSGTFALETGVTVFVKFSSASSAAYFTLNVNSTGAINVYTDGHSQSRGDYMWKGNDIVGFVYDGSYWRMIDSDRATSSYWGKVKLASSYTSSSSDTVPTSSHLYSVYTLANNKQDTLTAGDNVQINGNTISATDTTYTAGNNIQINGNTISATDTTYTAGAGIAIDQNNVISATGGGGGGITGDDAVVIADGAINNAFYSTTVVGYNEIPLSIPIPEQTNTNYKVAITPNGYSTRPYYITNKTTTSFQFYGDSTVLYDIIVFGQMATPNADLAELSDPDSTNSGDIRGELEELTTISI